MTDTIVALATAPGPGAVAVVRMSGSLAVEIVSSLASVEDGEWRPRHATLSRLRTPGGEALDQALVTVFPAPESYTGEDVVEISTHGGYLIPRSVVEACIARGAREARRGEFTQRAFLHGKVDLTQAEAVGDLVSTTAPKSAAVALHQLERGLGDRIARLRSDVVGLHALLIQHVDFPEEDDAPVPLDEIGAEARRVAGYIQALVETAPSGELLREGALTVLAGPPNAGKSSLFNALLGSERAIVTEEAGTTRDALEAVVSLAGFPFRLVDTAGLRRGAGRVEQMGIEVAERYLSEADLVLYCSEATGAPSSREEAFISEQDTPVILVRTKSDLGSRGVGEGMVASGYTRAVSASVRLDGGLSDLTREMLGMVFKGVVENRGEVPVVTTERQRVLLEDADAEVNAFAAALDEGVPPEVAQSHLKTAESKLEEVLGMISTDDVLDRVFREFCIGK